MAAKGSLRTSILDILYNIGELNREQADALHADPDADLDFAQLTFDSLTVLGFCLDVETRLGVVINPDEMVEVPSLRALEVALVERKPSLAPA